MKRKFRIYRNKVFKKILKVILYLSLYIASIAFCCWGFLQGMTY